MNDVPETITQDRSDACDIISAMLDNPGDHEIYPTTEAYNKFEELLQRTRIEAVGWTWSEACIQLDNGEDPRKYEQSQLIKRATKDLNPPWSYNKPLAPELESNAVVEADKPDK